MATQQEAERSERQQRREPQQAGMARRGTYSGREFLPAPTDFFLMNPFSVMRRLTDEMNRAFEGGASTGGASTGNVPTWAPVIDVTEQDGKYIVRAELAGIKPENVKISADDDALIIEGERVCEHDENQSGVHRTERRYGKFYRRIPLPEGAEVDQAKARFDNGVLEISVPISTQVPGRKEIPIEGVSSTGQSGSQQSGTQASGTQPGGGSQRAA